jgi:hypothetical protein
MGLGDGGVIMAEVYAAGPGLSGSKASTTSIIDATSADDTRAVRRVAVATQVS